MDDTDLRNRHGQQESLSSADALQVVLEVDGRRRVTLGRLGRREHLRYLATEDPDGTIVLRPAVVMTELEAKMMADPQLVARIEANRADPTRMVKRRRKP